MRTTTILSLALGVALLAHGAPGADAGGLSRPNPISARGIGMGGAFVAVADDPTALHFNPAGLARLESSHVLVGGEFVVAPRTYEPEFANGRCAAADAPESCQSQSPASPVRPLPVLGWAGRFDDRGVPSRLALGVGVWNTYGGQLEYDRFEDQDIPALNSTLNATIELVPGVAYQVNDVLALGVAFRLGFGLFSVDTTAKPTDADLQGFGLGAGATAGIMVTPSDGLAIGAVYRTGLTNKITGDGTITSGTSELAVDLELDQEWPQSAGLGIAIRPSDALLVAAQVDWTDWSELNALEVSFPGQESLNQTFILDFDDNYAVHLGAEYAATGAIAVRAGYSYDSPAVPDATHERQFLDTEKHLFALGGSYALTDSLRIDTAIETGPGGSRTIPDNSAELGRFVNQPLGRVSPTNRANAAPGEHSGTLFTFELTVQYLY